MTDPSNWTGGDDLDPFALFALADEDDWDEDDDWDDEDDDDWEDDEDDDEDWDDEDDEDWDDEDDDFETKGGSRARLDWN